MAASAMSASGEAPLRIALMIECDGPGGAELMMLELAKELRARGHTVLPVGLSAGTGWLGARFVAAGFEPASFELRGPLDLKAVRALTAILRDFRADVVHSHEFTMAIYGAAAAKRASARHVITMHGGLYYSAAWRRRAALEMGDASKRRARWRLHCDGAGVEGHPRHRRVETARGAERNSAAHGRARQAAE